MERGDDGAKDPYGIDGSQGTTRPRGIQRNK